MRAREEQRQRNTTYNPIHDLRQMDYGREDCPPGPVQKPKTKRKKK